MKLKPPRFAHAWLALIVVCISMILLPLTGCNATADDLRAGLAQAQQESVALDTAIAESREVLAALPEGEQRDELLAEVDKGIAAKAQIDATIVRLNERIKNADSVIGIVAETLKEAGSVIPAPYGTAAGLLGILLAGIAESKRRRTKTAATDVVQAIETVKKSHSNTVDFNEPTVKTELRSAMSTEARKLVEQARAAPGS